ncbi:GxGYxYP domain-containing protein [Streptomyces olivoreticuli]
MFSVEVASADVRVLLATLQGLTSQRRLRIYLSGPFEEGSDSWLRELGVPCDPVEDQSVHTANGLVCLVSLMRGMDEPTSR